MELLSPLCFAFDVLLEATLETINQVVTTSPTKTQKV